MASKPKRSWYANTKVQIILNSGIGLFSSTVTHQARFIARMKQSLRPSMIACRQVTRSRCSTQRNDRMCMPSKKPSSKPALPWRARKSDNAISRSLYYSAVTIQYTSIWHEYDTQDDQTTARCFSDVGDRTDLRRQWSNVADRCRFPPERRDRRSE